MRKMIGGLAAAILLAALAGCGKTSSGGNDRQITLDKSGPGTASVASALAEGERPRANPEEWIEGVESPAEFLNDEQYAQYLRAREALTGFTMSAGWFGSIYSYPYPEGYQDLYVEVEGRNFLAMTGEFETWAGFEGVMTSIYTPEFFADLSAYSYLEIDGLAYFSEGDRGSDITHLYNLYVPVELGEERAEFLVLGHYIDDIALTADLERLADYAGPVRQEVFPVVMERRDGVWLVSRLTPET